ncbi:ankyrin repeat domain-containing protein 17 [Trichoderma asperellum]|uniref:Ankyrin repeat domain-containing protein 17 n=1 Tax=Trichoderma asperellum TaxID=101201 RepID=A0A6V8QWE5_TRIAP|nr:ankyrin repeat domain-containing protein 17 [Trichoderma asperellum]
MSQLNDILNWLTPISYGPVQSSYIRKRQKETGQWLLDSTVFNAWVATGQKTLFCPGIPGAGKTILTSIVVDHLTSKFEGDPNVGVGYIYCNFKRSNEQSIHDLLANLSKQLLNQLAEDSAPLPQIVENLYTRHQAHRTKPSREELSTALHSVAAKYVRVFIIVDALDECESNGCWVELLEELFNLQNSQRINIFATSRHVPEIIDQFKGNSELLEIRASDQDVERFLDIEIQNLGRLRACVRENYELQQEIKTGIAKSAGGMFLLAQIYINTLSGKTSTNEIRSALRAFQNQNPESSGDREVNALKKAYGQTIKRIKKQQLDEVKLAMNVLAWLTCAKRQLTKSELQHALATKLGAAGFNPDDVPGTDVMVSVNRPFHQTPLHLAASDGNERVVKLLLDKGANIDAKDNEARSFPMEDRKYGGTPLCEAVVMEHEAVVRLLLEEGANVEAENNDGLVLHTPLFLAAWIGNEDIVRLLLENGADIEAKDHETGLTALHQAASEGHTAVVRLLVEAGADIEARYRPGDATPLVTAAEAGSTEVVELLLEKGADIEARNDGEETRHTPLFQAACMGNEDVVWVLIMKGADIEVKDKVYACTALHHAANRGHTAAVRVLLHAGADIETRGDQGNTTPLLTAVGNRKNEIVELLLEKGADIEARNWRDKTALDLAKDKENYKGLALLAKKKAEIEKKEKRGDFYGHRFI